MISFEEHIQQGKTNALEIWTLLVEQRGVSKAEALAHLQQQVVTRTSVLNVSGASLRGFLEDAATVQGFAAAVADLRFA